MQRCFKKMCMPPLFCFEERVAQKLSGKIRMLQLHRHPRKPHPRKPHPRKLGRRWRSEGDTGCIHSSLRLLCSFGFWFWNLHGICVVAGNLPAPTTSGTRPLQLLFTCSRQHRPQGVPGGGASTMKDCALCARGLVISCETKERLTCSHYCIPVPKSANFVCVCARGLCNVWVVRVYFCDATRVFISLIVSIFTPFYAGCHIVARAGHWSLGRRIATGGSNIRLFSTDGTVPWWLWTMVAREFWPTFGLNIYWQNWKFIIGKLTAFLLPLAQKAPLIAADS